MKKTQFIELIKNIKGTIIMFFSILMFVALGVSMFGALSWTADGVKEGLNEAADIGLLHDVQLIFPYGLTEDDVATLKNIEGVDEIETGYFAYEYFRLGENMYQAEILQLGENIDVPISVEGTLPSKAGEAAVSAEWAKENDISIGDTITFNHDDSGDTRMVTKLMNYQKESDDPEELMDNNDLSPFGMAYLTTDTFTVTALCENAQFVASDPHMNGISTTNMLSVDCVIYTVEDSFDSTAFPGYPRAVIRSDALRGLSTFGSKYKDGANDLKDRIDDTATEIAEERYNQLHGNIESIEDDSQEKLDDAEQQISDAQKKLSDGEQQLEDARTKISDGEAQIEEAEQKIKDGETQLAEAKKKLDDGATQISDGETQIAAAQAKIDSGQATVDSGSAQLASAKSELASKENELAQATAKINTAQSDLNFANSTYGTAVAIRTDIGNCLASGSPTVVEVINEIQSSGIIDNLYTLYAKYQDKIDAAMPQLIEQIVQAVADGNIQSLADLFDMVDGKINTAIGTAQEQINQYQAQINSGAAQVEAARAQIASKEAELNAGIAQLNSAKSQLAEKQAELDSAKQTYADGLAEYEKKEKELEDGKKELEEKKEELEDGKKELAEKEEELEEGKDKLASAETDYENGQKDLENFRSQSTKISDYGCSISLRSSCFGFRQGSVISDIFCKLRFSLAGLFVVVGLLVCYSAIMRIVNEQIVRIGTKKALGLYQREIVLHYLMYTGLAVGIGCLLGLVVGTFVVENIILSAIRKIFVVKTFSVHFNALQALLVCALEFGLLLLITWVAAGSILKKNAISLLKGQEPPAGKERFYEKFTFWKKLPLLTKTILNNCVNDKRRVFGTVIGIAGSSALIVTALTMRDNILDSFTTQYNDYYHFDTIVYYDRDTDGAKEAIEQVLADHSVSYANVYNSSIGMNQPDGELTSASLTVPTDDKLKELIDFEPVGDASADAYSGIWMEEGYENYFGEDAKTIELVEADGGTETVEVDGFYSYYLMGQQMFMSKDAYESTFHEKLKGNAFFVNTEGCDAEALKAALLEVNGYISTSDYYNASMRTFNTFSSISTTMVAVYVGLAVLMALVVLLNLLSMFVLEKKKELIVLMINGFSLKDAKRYIYTDTIFLAIIGIILGLLLGTLFGGIAVTNFESAATMFLRRIDFKSWIFGAAGSAVLTFIMSLISLRSIGKFKLSDINNI